MKSWTFIGAALFFACIVVLANYTVQYQVFGTSLTYGAFTYPLSFLFMDILSEKYEKKQVLKILWLGLFIAFVPSLFIAETRIAIASVCAFVISQNLDVHVFYYLKNRFPSLWWLRNNASTMLSQFVDTMIFFHIAFLFIYPWGYVVAMLLSDFAIKAFIAFCDTPLFYAIAIKGKSKFTNKGQV